VSTHFFSLGVCDVSTRVAFYEKVFGEGVRLQREGILQKVDADSTFYFARLNKLWFADLDGNAWEIFTVHEQLA